MKLLTNHQKNSILFTVVCTLVNIKNADKSAPEGFMKKIRILSIIIAVLLVATAFAACGKDNDNTDSEVSSSVETEAREPNADEMYVNISISTDDYGTLYEKDIIIDRNNANVLTAILAACDQEGFVYELNDEMNSISSIGEFDEKEKNKLSYYWAFTVNGKEVSGRALDNKVKENDKIAYNYTGLPTGDYVTVSFESSDGKTIVKPTCVVFDDDYTVLDAAVDAVKRAGLEYSMTESGDSFQNIDRYKSKVTPTYNDEWVVTVGGKTISEAPSEVSVKSNDKIVFTFTRVEKEVTEE